MPDAKPQCDATLTLADGRQAVTIRCKMPAGHDGTHSHIGITGKLIYGINWREHGADQPRGKARHDDA